MSFFDREELGKRIYARYEKSGRRQDGPISIHCCTRCKLQGFVAVGPLFQGRRDAGMSWFDIRIQPNTMNYVILNKLVREICGQIGLYYQEPDEEDLDYVEEDTDLEEREIVNEAG